MNKEKILEEELKDKEDTLPSSEIETETTENLEAPVPELNSDPIPTEEQVEDANLNPDTVNSNSEEVVEDTISENVAPETLTEEQEAVEKMFTQSQVDEIAGRSRAEGNKVGREKAMADVYSRYGVNGDADLDEAVGKSQKYDLLREDYDKLAKELSDIKVKLAMYDSGIDPNRYEDAKLILSGKNLEITPENISKELTTHPEWKKVLPTPASANDDITEMFKKVEPKEPVSTISTLGNEATTNQQSGSTERENALDLFH